MIMAKPRKVKSKLQIDLTAENAVFREAVQDVTPLNCDKVPLYQALVPAIPHQLHLESRMIQQDMLSEAYDPAELETGEELVFVRAGIQHSVVHKLRRGQLSINAELDLHGMIVRHAREAVANFLRDCCHRHVRCARIVHGKGNGSWQKQPVLKVKLNHWLRQRDEVLAFCSARGSDGGTGAVYVLIKHR